MGIHHAREDPSRAPRWQMRPVDSDRVLPPRKIESWKRKRKPDRRQRIGRSGVVDPGRAGLARFGEHDERRKHRGHGIAVAAQLTRWAAMHAVGEALADLCAARTVLRQRGRTGRRPLDAAMATGDRRHSVRLAIDR